VARKPFSGGLSPLATGQEAAAGRNRALPSTGYNAARADRDVGDARQATEQPIVVNGHTEHTGHTPDIPLVRGSKCLAPRIPRVSYQSGVTQPLLPSVLKEAT
jgi:hypothetical protein